MRWLVGLPLTELTADETSGLCKGTGRKYYGGDHVQVLFAGVAVESGYGLCQVDLSASPFDDLDEERQQLCEHEVYRLVPTDDGRTRIGKLSHKED